MIRRYIARLIAWLIPELAELRTQIAVSRANEKLLADSLNQHRVYAGLVATHALQVGARVDRLEMAPVDRSLGVRVARLELTVLPPLHEEMANSALVAGWKANGGEG